MLGSDDVRVEFETARGRVIPGTGSQVATFFVALEIWSEQLTGPEQAELTHRLSTRIMEAIAEEYGGEEIEVRRRE